MLRQVNPTAWILLGSYALLVLALPLLIGVVSRTARRDALLSTLCGLLGVAVVLGIAVYLRGVRGLPPGQAALVLFAASAAVAALVGWLTLKIAEIFRHETPLAAAWSALRFLSLTAVGVALLLVAINGLTIVAQVDFADEIPELVYLRLELVHYLNIAAATIICLVWIVTSTRRGQTSNAMGRTVVQVLPGTVAVLLFLPILMAYVQVAWSTPLLDCSPRRIPGYVPDMIDFTRLVLDALAAGALFGLKSALGWQIATCVSLPTSRLASWLVYALNLAPITLLALLAYRFRSLRHARRATS
jgi:hypothetical protein